ncbi:MAG TPA: hypothetical protein VN962_17370 [Polyangia bacterium]|nr:hypothetical protein [Polyangia bacterium]
MLAHRLARPLGLFEPIGLDRARLDPITARLLGGRLDVLDPAGGYRPGAEGNDTALGWVIAGAVIAGTPAQRAQNLFYDPSRGNGLSEAGGLFQTGYALRMLFAAGGGLRGAATGTTFNLTGRPSTEWLVAPDNDVGLRVFYDQLEAAGTSPDLQSRSTALARSLLALGGTLAVLEEAGDPAHVRNDFRGAFMRAGGSSPFDRGSSYERYVTDTFGQSGIPAPAAPVERPTVMAYITASDRQGLADRTQRRFFSDGSLPPDVVVDRETTPAEVMQDARESLPYAFPTVPHLDLAALGDVHYAYAPVADDAGQDGQHVGHVGLNAKRRRLLAYLRVPGRVRFFLDPSVYHDTASTLLPEVGGYAAGLIDHLFRVEIKLEFAARALEVQVTGARGAVSGGQVRLYADDGAGNRRAFATVPAAGGRVTIPAGARRIAAVLRGSDAAGELVAVSEAAVP